MDDTIIYEYPLSEKIRTWLRLHHLFDQFNILIESRPINWEIVAFKTLFEIVDVVEYGDLRSDLIVELERARQFLIVLAQKEDVDQDELNKLMQDIERISIDLRSTLGRPSHVLCTNPWISLLRSKMSSSGKCNEFDLPSFHWWHHQPEDKKIKNISDFFAIFKPYEAAISILLRLIRESSTIEQFGLNDGTLNLNNTHNSVLLRFYIPAKARFFPEVSANRFQINIRMLAFPRDCWDQLKVDDSVTIGIRHCMMASAQNQ